MISGLAIVFHLLSSFPLTFYVDEDFSLDERLIILEAQERWQERSSFGIDLFDEENTGETQKIKIGNWKTYAADAKIGVYKITNWKKLGLAQRNNVLAATQVTGDKDEKLGIIRVKTVDIFINYDYHRFDRKLLYKTVMHEIGHLLGVPHNRDMHSIMYENIGDWILDEDEKNLSASLQVSLEYDKHFYYEEVVD